MIEECNDPQYIEQYMSCDSRQKGMKSVLNCIYCFLNNSLHVSLV